jgi:alkanesulfonate monooxygenase SsuD/methylene tetrahydromethanopterin reductase-like flavin-dependent oxidoreductase (luciferase family)
MSFGISLQTSPPVSALGGADALSNACERAREAEAAGVPASVTADPDGARAHAFEYLGGNARNPSYQAALEREGISHPAGLALVGDEETVAAGIRRYLDAGATDVRVSPAAFATDEERLRTWRLVGELARDAAKSKSRQENPVVLAA